MPRPRPASLSWPARLAPLLLALTAGACASLIGLDDYERVDGPAPPSGPGEPCTPAATETCYGGPAGTQGQGVCRAGTRTCSDAGEWGACEGEVRPGAEVCATAVDDDCDGQANEEGADCVCVPGSTTPCYTGPAGTEGVGACAGGQQVCNDHGNGYGPCTGEVLPAAEVCGTDVDEDCDGAGWFTDGDTDCVCQPGTTAACYTGPMGTEGVGACHAGTWSCNADGLGYGACAGEVLPAASDICGNAVLDDDCDGAACSGEVEWAIAAGGGGDQTVHDVAVDGAGNVYVVGELDGSISIGAQPGQTVTSEGIDGFLLKLNADGSFAWVKRFGPAQTQVARGVAVDAAGNVYVTGYFNGSIDVGQFTLTSGGSGDEDVFVAKLDANGDALWANDYGSANADQLALGIDVTPQGDAAITGTFDGTITFGNSTNTSAGGQDLFVAGMDTNGTPAWIRSFGDNQLQRGNRVAYGSNVFVTGDVEGSFQVGSTVISAGTSSDVLATRLDAGTAVPAWASRYGESGDVIGATSTDVATDSAGNVTLTGNFSGNINFGGSTLSSSNPTGFIARLSPSGVHLFSKPFPVTTGTLSSQAVDADGAGNVIVGGAFLGTADLGSGLVSTPGMSVDLFIVKLSLSLGHLWSRHYPATGDEYCTAVAATPSDHVIAAGHFNGSIDFGVTTVMANGVSNGDQTLFVVRLAP